MRRARLCAGALLVGALSLSGCWAPTSSTTPPTAASGTGPSSDASASTSALSFDCTDPIAESDAVASDMQTVLGVVAFTTQRTEPVAVAGGLWSKTGIQVRAARRFVIRSLTPGVTMNWSNTGDDRFVTQIVVDGCRGPTPQEWLSYPGGFRLRAPVCAELEVVWADRSARVRVPLGADC